MLPRQASASQSKEVSKVTLVSAEAPQDIGTLFERERAPIFLRSTSPEQQSESTLHSNYRLAPRPVFTNPVEEFEAQILTQMKIACDKRLSGGALEGRVAWVKEQVALPIDERMMMYQDIIQSLPPSTARFVIESMRAYDLMEEMRAVSKEILTQIMDPYGKYYESSRPNGCALKDSYFLDLFGTHDINSKKMAPLNGWLQLTLDEVYTNGAMLDTTMNWLGESLWQAKVGALAYQGLLEMISSPEKQASFFQIPWHKMENGDPRYSGTQQESGLAEFLALKQEQLHGIWSRIAAIEPHFSEIRFTILGARRQDP